MWKNGHAGGGATRAGRPATPRLAFALALLACAWLASAARQAGCAPAPVVVWNGGDRIAVAAPDSGTLALHASVRVLDGDRELARGEVTGVLDGVLASVRLTAGRLPSDARLDRLAVRIEPAPDRALAALRVGLPAPARSGLAFTCVDAHLDLAALPRPYAAETLAVGSFRLFAADSTRGLSPWPDTLLVRCFRDRADEEIALERGELDVAVFWPGEPSARMREGASGREVLLGARARGMLVALAAAPDTTLAAHMAADMRALNAELFGGDLRPWSEAEPGAPPPAGGPRGLRYTVDGALPGRLPVARFLNARLAAPPRPDDRVVRVAYLDVPAWARDSSAYGGHERTVVPLFTLRCPVIGSRARAADVRALGPDAFANLPGCGAGRRP